MNLFKTISGIFLITLLSNPFQASAQLKMPRKNCEGARATPDDLKSWCDSKYYNQCECQYEKVKPR